MSIDLAVVVDIRRIQTAFMSLGAMANDGIYHGRQRRRCCRPLSRHLNRNLTRKLEHTGQPGAIRIWRGAKSIIIYLAPF